MRALYIHLPRAIVLGIAVLLALALFSFIRFAVIDRLAASAMAPALFGRTIVIDPGHGGWDPGMSGISGSREAEVNLGISKKLAEYCRQGGANVIMTRENDTALADTKAEDMEKRVQLAADGDIFISIHCNSYPGQHGAQVFYEKGSTAGQALAECVQSSIGGKLGNTDRTAMIHRDSYLLKHIDGAAVICETGFLSDQAEEGLLQDENYQWEMAQAIFSGIVDYLTGAA